jgi:hypothetical protein
MKVAMPSAGLSLLGFMDRAQALAHLASVCIPEDSDEAALTKVWAAAKKKLGAPIPGAGSPSILTLPPACDAHCRAVLSQAAFREGGSFSGAFACLVETAPLLTPQFVVDRSRLAHHRAEARDATLEMALETCMPLTARSELFQTIAGPQSLLLKSRSMNVKFIRGGLFDGSVLGAKFGLSAPHVRVARYRGRCFIQNGVHRAVALTMMGLTHIPCLLRDVATPSEIGVVENATFPLDALESDNPPTLGHFINGRACEVTLRSLSRILQVSWAEYTVPDE